VKLISALNVILKETDEELIKKISLNDSKAFEIFYGKYNKMIYTYFLYQTSTFQAEELLQETFLKVYKYAEQFKAQSKVTTWLWSIARNTLIDTIRIKKVPTVELEEEIDVSIPSIEEDLIIQGELEIIKNCMKKIDPKNLEILLLRVESELSYEEISVLTKYSVANIKTILFRTKKELIKLFKEQIHE
jgi:RNA polymerase sigma-70 factor (ECF subfamily)